MPHHLHTSYSACDRGHSANIGTYINWKQLFISLSLSLYLVVSISWSRLFGFCGSVDMQFCTQLHVPIMTTIEFNLLVWCGIRVELQFAIVRLCAQCVTPFNKDLASNFQRSKISIIAIANFLHHYTTSSSNQTIRSLNHIFNFQQWDSHCTSKCKILLIAGDDSNPSIEHEFMVPGLGIAIEAHWAGWQTQQAMI